ncbi:hypothetical protein G6F60_015554 [Rhizopus arrhizus]|nr:hypothetical protein G6F60_015554 [Rhizopus arrhizus]
MAAQADSTPKATAVSSTPALSQSPRAICANTWSPSVANDITGSSRHSAANKPSCEIHARRGLHSQASASISAHTPKKQRSSHSSRFSSATGSRRLAQK